MNCNTQLHNYQIEPSDWNGWALIIAPFEFFRGVDTNPSEHFPVYERKDQGTPERTVLRSISSQETFHGDYISECHTTK